MHGGSPTQRPSSASLISVALVAIGVLVLALVVAGNQKGTIVVQRLTQRLPHVAAGRPAAITLTIIAETSASGDLRRLYARTSLGRRQESLLAGQKLEAYLPRDNTIYVMTERTLRQAEQRYVHVPTAARARTASFSYNGTWLAPGRTSFFAVQLRSHNYRVAGRATIDGRPAIRLVPVHPMIRVGGPAHEQILLQTAYVSPRTYEPIEESQPGFGATVWTQYRVLSDTAANRRLLSLTARHPSAHVSDNANAYVRAIQVALRRS